MKQQPLDEEDEKEFFQFRRTFEDTIKNQKRLKEFVNKKKKNHTYVTYMEAQHFEGLVARSFLSQGNWRQCYYENEGVKIPLGPVHTFALNLAKVKSKQVHIKRFSFSKTVDISDLWRVLEDEFSYIFPGALEEALRISGEGTKEKRTEPFSFSGGPID